jgi:conjugative transfer pilus assembly protein TraH
MSGYSITTHAMASVSLTLVGLWLTVFSGVAQADVNSALGNFFDQLDYGVNVSQARAYQGQQADYYSGGDLFVRTGVQDSQISRVMMPSVNAGCGGIDLFMGGFSHINSDQLVSLGKAIVSNAIPFGFDLALQTWAPQIKSIRDNLQTISDRYLTQSINSCESAQAAIGGLWPFKNAQSQKHICATMGMQNNAFADWAAAQQGCGAGGQFDQHLSDAQGDPILQPMVNQNVNIVWQAINANAFLRDDPELAEFFQSLSGTLVFDQEGHRIRYPSLLTANNHLINDLLNGGTATIWRCDNRSPDRCLVLTEDTVTINDSQALKMKIALILADIIHAYHSDQSLTDQQKGFLEYTSLPVLKMMATTLEAGQQPRIAAYADVIAARLITDYLHDSLRVVRNALGGSAADPDAIEPIYATIDRASELLRASEQQGLATLQAEQVMIDHMLGVEQRIEGAFSARARQSLLFDGT